MQIELINYLVESSLCLLLGGFVYFFFLRQVRQHQWSRYFLLLWPIICLSLPLFQINWIIWVEPTTSDIPTSEYFHSYTKTPLPQKAPMINLLSPMEQEAIGSKESINEVNKETLLSLFQALNLIYFFGLGIGLILFLLKGLSLHKIIRSAEVNKTRAYTLMQVKHLPHISSFGRIIFKNKDSELHPMILEHELVHIKQWHSLDILLIELIAIIQWFNPMIYLFKEEIKINHEYIADQSVIKKYDLIEYARLLVDQSLKGGIPYLCTSFAQFTKQRLINMKTKTNNSWSRIRYLILLPLLTYMVYAFSLEFKEKSKVAPVSTMEAPAFELAPPPFTDALKSTYGVHIRWGDYTCNCFESNVAGNFFCDLVSLPLASVKELAKLEPAFYKNGELMNSEGKKKEYTLTIKNRINSRENNPVHFSEGYFNMDAPFWEKLNKGDHLKFRATLPNDKVIEFPIGVEGENANKVKELSASFGKNIFPINPINSRAEYELDANQMNALLKEIPSLWINKKEVSFKGIEIRRGNSGSNQYLFTDFIAYEDFAKLNEQLIFKNLEAGEEIILKFFKDIKSFIIKFKIKGTYALEQEDIRMEWGAYKSNSNYLNIEVEDLDKLKNSIPKVFIDGKEIDLEKSAFIYNATPNSQLRELGKWPGVKKYQGQQFPILVKQRLALLAEDQKTKFEIEPGSEEKFSRIEIMGEANSWFGFILEDGRLLNLSFFVNYERSPLEKYEYKLFNAAFKLAYPIPKSFVKKPASGYGMRMHPIFKKEQFHKGVDFTAPAGTPVLAARYGEVILVENQKNAYGKRIIIQHGDGLQTMYAQLQSFSVKVGERINGQEQIGTVGSTGASTGPHLHFEVLKDGERENPMDYLPKLED